jgi:hypothetical protein
MRAIVACADHDAQCPLRPDHPAFLTGEPPSGFGAGWAVSSIASTRRQEEAWCEGFGQYHTSTSLVITVLGAAAHPAHSVWFRQNSSQTTSSAPPPEGIRMPSRSMCTGCASSSPRSPPRFRSATSAALATSWSRRTSGAAAEDQRRVLWRWFALVALISRGLDMFARSFGMDPGC